MVAVEADDVGLPGEVACARVVASLVGCTLGRLAQLDRGEPPPLAESTLLSHDLRGAWDLLGAERLEGVARRGVPHARPSGHGASSLHRRDRMPTGARRQACGAGAGLGG